MPTDVWLQWDDGLASPVSTRVERSPDDNQNFSEVANVAPPAQNHKDAALADGTYFYRTRHEITPGVFSGYSNEDSITVGSAPGPAVLVEDSFDRADGPLDSTTPDIANVPGDTWRAVASFETRGNRLERFTGSNLRIADIDGGLFNGTVSFLRIRNGAPTNPLQNVMMRIPAKDVYQGVGARISEGANSLQVRERVTSWTSRGALTITNALTDQVLSLTLDGDQATADYGGESFTTTITSYAASTSTIVGIEMSESPMYADNFKVTELP